MITAIVFSRDRAAQLDLLLRSIERGGVTPFDPVHVIAHATDAGHRRAYEMCMDDHPDVRLYEEAIRPCALIAADLLSDTAGLACFLTDDSVFYRQPLIPSVLSGDVICHSFRLGLNTTWCYPHARSQVVPASREREIERGEMAWGWQGADGDFGYPGSLDGHVFRASHLRRMLRVAPEGANPNRLEDHFIRWCVARLASDYPLMTCEAQSSLVSIPVNRVNATHPNRYGDRFPISAGELLGSYLAGGRLVMPEPDDVRGAHQEYPLRFA